MKRTLGKFTERLESESEMPLPLGSKKLKITVPKISEEFVEEQFEYISENNAQLNNSNIRIK